MTDCPHCGCEIEAKPKGRPRSVPQHRRYFALVKAAFSHWPEKHRFRPMTEEHLRKWLQAKAGYANIQMVDTAGMDGPTAIVAVAAMLAAADPIHFTAIKGSRFYVVSSRSINFDELPHLEACALFDAVADVIRAETGLEPDEIMPPIRKAPTGRREMLAEVPI